jgi:hypothetical protein
LVAVVPNLVNQLVNRRNDLGKPTGWRLPCLLNHDVLVLFRPEGVQRVTKLDGYTRGKISPERAASEKLDDWRDISRGDADES